MEIDGLQPHEVIALENGIIDAINKGDKEEADLNKVLQYLVECQSIPGKTIPKGF